jgi:hypothetical protein
VSSMISVILSWFILLLLVASFSLNTSIIYPEVEEVYVITPNNEWRIGLLSYCGWGWIQKGKIKSEGGQYSQCKFHKIAHKTGSIKCEAQPESLLSKKDSQIKINRHFKTRSINI